MEARKIVIDGNVARVPLTQGKMALIDAGDANIVVGLNWFAVRHPCGLYARATKDGKSVSMHRLITGASGGFVVDHSNHDPLDNRRSNLRVCSTAQNLFNKRISSKNTSGYKGVCWSKDRQNWVATVYAGGKKYRKFAFKQNTRRRRTGIRCFSHRASRRICQFEFPAVTNAASQQTARCNSRAFLFRPTGS